MQPDDAIFHEYCRLELTQRDLRACIVKNLRLRVALQHLVGG